MAKEQFINSLDIGTSYVRVVQSKLDPTNGKLAVIGAAIVPSFGMRKGVIVEVDEVVSSISNAVEKVERMTGVPVSAVHVSVGGQHLVCFESKGTIAVARADGVIADSDIVRVVDSSQAVSLPPNREILHVLPRSFSLDGQAGIKDPLGMSGIRLEVETAIIHAGIPFIKNLSRAVNQAGLTVLDIVAQPLASAYAVLSRKHKELGSVCVDIGGGTTSLAVYEENTLLHAAVFPIGGINITNDIAIGLRISTDAAEKIKLQYGAALPEYVGKNLNIELAKVDPESSDHVNKLDVIEIIQARLEEIFRFVELELKKIGREGKLPAGVVLTGGTSQLLGLVDFAKNHLRLPASLGTVKEVETIIDKVNDPSFSGTVGLVLWANRYFVPREVTSVGAVFDSLLSSGFVLQLKKWFRSFLP
ncbi:MAG TPA: cell division protein FtsA [Patescibacteria group bacterium]|nr:cell division protein FtsA [Patescibacteria group bacterium]